VKRCFSFGTAYAGYVLIELLRVIVEERGCTVIVDEWRAINVCFHMRDFFTTRSTRFERW
jgi:hypothetical protein